MKELPIISVKHFSLLWYVWAKESKCRQAIHYNAPQKLGHSSHNILIAN